MSVRLFLVRHGESEWNRSRRYAGQRDVALSERGRDQARRLARRLADEQFSAIYASPLQRARETASIIADQMGMPVILDAGLEEIDHGAWQGMTTSEVASQFPAEYAMWQSHPHSTLMPGGESLSDVVDRVQASLDRLVTRQTEGNLLFCAHDTVLRIVALRYLDIGLRHFWKLSFQNASLSLLERQESAGNWRLVCLNDFSHLAGACAEYALQAL